MTMTTPSPGRLLIAGTAGEFGFELFALGLAPATLGMAMKPALLVVALGETLLGAPLPLALGWAVHLLAGIVLFPIGYVLFWRLTRPRGWVTGGALWGATLWLLAQAILAPLAGRPFMLGFVPYTWFALAAHLVYALPVAFVLGRVSPGAR